MQLKFLYWNTFKFEVSNYWRHWSCKTNGLTLAYSFLRGLCSCRILREGIWASISHLCLLYKYLSIVWKYKTCFPNIALSILELICKFLRSPHQWQYLTFHSEVTKGNFLPAGTTTGVNRLCWFHTISQWLRRDKNLNPYIRLYLLGCKKKKDKIASYDVCFVCQISQIQHSNVRWVAGWNVPKNCKSSLEIMQCCFLLWIIA